METIVKWFAVPLGLAIVWILLIFINDADLLENLSPAARLALKIAIATGAVLLLATIWVFRRQSGG